MKTHGSQKYPESKLLLTSSGHGWTGLSAELRCHGLCDTPAVVPRQLELSMAIAGSNEGYVTRTGGGVRQQTVPRNGTIWILPATVHDDEINNAGRDISLGELAAVACVSVYHFSRMFRAAVGVTPQRYLRELYLKRAKDLLADGRLCLAQIALATHFSSQASFTRAFTREVGMSPGEYRRRCR